MADETALGHVLRLHFGRGARFHVVLQSRQPFFLAAAIRFVEHRGVEDVQHEPHQGTRATSLVVGESPKIEALLAEGGVARTGEQRGIRSVIGADHLQPCEKKCDDGRGKHFKEPFDP